MLRLIWGRPAEGTHRSSDGAPASKSEQASTSVPPPQPPVERFLAVKGSVLAALSDADDGAGSDDCAGASQAWWAPTNHGRIMRSRSQRARCEFVHAAAAAPPRVPMALARTYRSWVDDVIAARGGAYAFARGEHQALHAFVCTHALGLPNASSLMERLTSWRVADAADLIACLAACGLLTDAHEPRAPADLADVHGSRAPADLADVLLAWLARTLDAFDARIALQTAAAQGDVPRLLALLCDEEAAMEEAAVEEEAAAAARRGISTVAVADCDREYALCSDKARCLLDEQLPAWPPSGETCLYVAAKRGHAAAVATLLRLGASVDEPSCDGWRPIHGTPARLRARVRCHSKLVGAASLRACACAVLHVPHRRAPKRMRSLWLQSSAAPSFLHRVWTLRRRLLGAQRRSRGAIAGAPCRPARDDA